MAAIDRGEGALTGLFIADALAMPAHWYYRRAALLRDYGHIVDYQAPRNPHADSILWRSRYVAPNERGEILHDQARFWGRRDVHYHQNLRAGESTLNLQLCRLLIESLNECRHYDPDDYLERYVRFMTTPGMHRDTYVEECHRHFFTNYANGAPPRQCAATEKHIGGLAGVIPVIVFYASDPDAAHAAAREHVALTHAGAEMASAATLVADLLLDLLTGADLREVLTSRIARRDDRWLAHPYDRWLDEPDGTVVGRRVSSACYLDDALPATLYLALKYHDDPQAALIANTNLGGDNCHRGAVLGALMGAAHGPEGFPERWRDGLFESLPTLRDVASSSR